MFIETSSELIVFVISSKPTEEGESKLVLARARRNLLALLSPKSTDQQHSGDKEPNITTIVLSMIYITKR